MVAVRRSGVGEELPYVLVPRNKRPKKMKGGGRQPEQERESSIFLSQTFIITYDLTIITIIEISSKWISIAYKSICTYDY